MNKQKESKAIFFRCEQCEEKCKQIVSILKEGVFRAKPFNPDACLKILEKPIGEIAELKKESIEVPDQSPESHDMCQFNDRMTCIKPGDVCYDNCPHQSISFVEPDSPLLGLHPDAPVVINPKGATESRSYYRFDLIDPHALFKLARTMYEGAEKHGVDNWRNLSQDTCINHALTHIYAYLAGDKQDDHLARAFTRIMMAVALEK